MIGREYLQPTSIRELAKLACVSPSTVSLALRNSPKIPAATSLRIRELAAEKNYRPNPVINELMSHLRMSRSARHHACLGFISLYDNPRPWEISTHLNRIWAGMVNRADELGYRLEPLWLRSPGMTPRRLRDILDARGVEGLLSFGSPDMDQEWPAELDHFAVVTLGLSIRTPLHRVTSHHFNDMLHALDRVYRLGYRRPGLVLGCYEDARSGHAFSGAYFGWYESQLGLDRMPAVLRLERLEEKPLIRWLGYEQPDVIVFVHVSDVLVPLRVMLERHRTGAAVELGVVVLSHLVEGTGFAGLQQDQALMGARAVEKLVVQIANRDFGLPANPWLEMVKSNWVDGASLRPAALHLPTSVNV